MSNSIATGWSGTLRDLKIPQLLFGLCLVREVTNLLRTLEEWNGLQKVIILCQKFRSVVVPLYVDMYQIRLFKSCFFNLKWLWISEVNGTFEIALMEQLRNRITIIRVMTKSYVSTTFLVVWVLLVSCYNAAIIVPSSQSLLGTISQGTPMDIVKSSISSVTSNLIKSANKTDQLPSNPQGTGVSNIIIGKSNSISGANNTIEGNFNKGIGIQLDITGNQNQIKGANTTVVGNLNTQTKGRDNILFGNSNSIEGNTNTLVGDSNILTGNSNSLLGNSNAVKGNLNTVAGNVNSIQGDNNTAVGDFNSVKGSSSLLLGHNNTVNGDSNSIKGNLN